MVAAAVAAVAAAPACHYVVVGVEDSQGSQGDLLGPSLVELLLLLHSKNLNISPLRGYEAGTDLET